MDFTISPGTEDYRARIARFVEEGIPPLERDRTHYDSRVNIRTTVLTPLRGKAKAEGLRCPQLKEETGGQNPGFKGMAVCYERQ